MRILAVDTTAEFGSIALIENNLIAREIGIEAPSGFGQVLFDEIKALLEQHSISLQDIDCFASAKGPGTFTGVRVGLAAVKGLAFALSKPICAISNLEAIAFRGSAQVRAAFLDARRGDIFGALFNSDLKALTEEVVTSLPLWIASLPREVELLTTDTAVMNIPGLCVKAVGHRLAGVIGLLAAKRFAQGLQETAAAIDANYVRRADAELFWVDK